MTSKVPEKVKEIREWVADREPGSRSISFSQLSTYLNCPKCWQRTYILNEAPYSASINTTFGTAVHETIQEWLDTMYNKSIKEAAAMDLNLMLETKMHDIYKRDRESMGRDYSTAKELGEFYEDGVAILDYVKRNRATFFSPDKEWLVGCEIPILYKLRDGFYFKGFIDILTYDEINDIWKIWDIKTSTTSWSPEIKANKHKTNQVLLYKYFLSQQFNIDINKIDVEYFIVKRKIPKDPEYPSLAKRVQEFVPANKKPSIKAAVKDVTDFCNDVLTEAGSYQDKDFQALPSQKSCRWCVFREDCKSKV